MSERLQRLVRVVEEATDAFAFEELSHELAGRLKVIKVNVDENPRLAARFDARSIPTLVLLQDGEVRERVLGVQLKAALRRLVDAYL